MALLDQIKTDITDIIKANGVEAITGNVLGTDVLANILVAALGAYQFGGIAVPATNPGSPDTPRWYLATAAGTYTYFGAEVISAGSLRVIVWDGTSWNWGIAADFTAVDWDIIMANHKISELADGILDDDAATVGQMNTAIELVASKYLGTYVSLAALQSAFPDPGGPGFYANVDAGVGTDVVRYIWDDDDAAYVLMGSGGTGLNNIVEDLTPQLGGDLDVNGHLVGGRDIATDGGKLDGVEAGADVTDAGNVGAAIHGATEKTTPVDADEVGLIDSAATNVLKRLTWVNIKVILKAYFDTLYNLYAHPNHSGDVTSTGDGATAIASTAISDKTDAGALAGTEEVLINVAGTLKKTTVGTIGAGTGIANIVEDTTPQLGGQLDLNGKTVLIHPVGAGTQFSGEVIRLYVAVGISGSIGQLYSYDGATEMAVLADAASGKACMGMSTIVNDDSIFDIFIKGIVTLSGTTFTPGATLYLGNSGAISETPGATVQVIGYAILADTIWFDPQPQSSNIPTPLVLSMNSDTATDEATIDFYRADANGDPVTGTGSPTPSTYQGSLRWFIRNSGSDDTVGTGDDKWDLMGILRVVYQDSYTAGLSVKGYNYYISELSNILDISNGAATFGGISLLEDISVLNLTRGAYYYSLEVPTLSADVVFPLPANAAAANKIPFASAADASLWKTLQEILDALFSPTAAHSYLLYRNTSNAWAIFDVSASDGYLKFTTGAPSIEAGTGLANIVEDTTPQLGGDLDSQDKNITGVGRVSFTQELDLGSKTANFSVDFATDQKQKATLTANTLTLTFDTTAVGVGNYILKLVNGGLATLTWAAETGAVYWPGGTSPTLTASGTDIIAVYFDGTNFYCNSSLAFS